MQLPDPRLVSTARCLGARLGRGAPVRFSALHVVGAIDPPAERSVAVVGTRAPSESGRALARTIGAELAAAGVCVVSGLALGIDAAAHEGALDRGGRTIGVLGGGHAAFYPRRNLDLARRMLAAGGAVLSPFAPDEPPLPPRFLQRNGVVAALADAVVVVEAAARSGALNTAGWAADLGLLVFAVPGDVDRPKAAGCNALIRDGAVLIRTAADVLADLGWDAGPLAAPPGTAGDVRAGPLERKILARLRAGPTPLDALFEIAAEPGALLAALGRLELAGCLRRDDDLCRLVPFA